MNKFRPDAPSLGSPQNAKDGSASDAYKQVLRTLGNGVPTSPGRAFWRLAKYCQGGVIYNPPCPSYIRGQVDYYRQIVPVPGFGYLYTLDMVAAHLWALQYVRLDGKRFLRRTARWLTAARAVTKPGSDERKFIKAMYCQGIGQMARRGYGVEQAQLENLAQGRLRWAADEIETHGGVVIKAGSVDRITFWLPQDTAVDIPPSIEIGDRPGQWRVIDG